MTEEERTRLRANLQWRLNAPPEEEAAKFLRTCFGDQSWEEAEESLTQDAADNPHVPNWIVSGLTCLERLLADPATRPITLYNLVAWYAGVELEDHSDAAATAWLRAVAEMTRTALGNRQPPRPELKTLP